MVRVGADYVDLSLGEGMASIPMEVDVTVEDGEPLSVTTDWRPGEPVWRGTVGGLDVTAQLRPMPNGMRIGWRGMSVDARVYTLPRRPSSTALMPVKVAPDTAKLLLCPMPGLVVSIAVTEGQEVKAGETLAVVEAMKMENVLRAERDGTIAQDQRQARRQPGGRRRDHGVRVSGGKGAAPALLFDLDGTLTDPFVGISRCIEFAMGKLDRPCPPVEELRWCIGLPLRCIFARLLETQDAALIDAACSTIASATPPSVSSRTPSSPA